VNDRHPPYSEDAEQAVIAAMMMDGEQVLPVLEILDDSMFYAERHRKIFRALVALTERSVVIDPLTLSNQLAGRGELESVGGKDYIGFLVDAVAHGDNAVTHAAIVREKCNLRRLIEAAVILQGEAFAGDRTARELARETYETLAPLTIEGESAGFQLLKGEVWPLMERIEARAGGAILGLTTGYKDIDNATGGFRGGELLIIAGAEKAGKSAVALNLCLRVANERHECAYVSAEMTRETLAERCLAWAARTHATKIAMGWLKDDDYAKLAKGAGILAGLPLWIDDEAEPSLADVVARCTRLKAQNPNLRMIVVDFLQLVHAREKGVTEAVELKRIAYGLKKLAKSLNVLVVAPCQVNTKDIEELKDPRPRLKDLQGSSGMRQAADFIALLFRPGMYDKLADESELELNFAACRRTASFTARLQWNGATQTIENRV
jgi:replicative DNA helicase